jgi:GH25 family lysozyme M1 (1,4-beta-N-acetylmuramidase)
VATTASAGRYPVAYDFYQSNESRHTRVAALYQALLGRAPDQGGWDYWAGVILPRGDLALAANLASSDEYYGNATVPIPTNTSPAPPVVSYTNGIDVSHYEGAIDWTSVAKSGERFVFAKATEGVTYSDANYAAYKQGATANGLLFGAYHFARPAGSDSTTIRNDAIAEADHFANVAGTSRGALLPVLDLEVTGGLSASDLKDWTSTYLDRIQFRLGVKAIIYSSPSFWENSLGNTTWFAANGYRVLWIAHYGVTAPRVPANNWNDSGWTFWQWTPCGTVPGIAGCVDRDYYQGTDLSSVLIP